MYLARRDLHEFVKQAWHVVEPATEYVDGWHIRAICDHLQAVSAGQIRNLLINMPPRHAKSLIVSVFWPVWEWLTHPARRWLYASYGQSLSTRDSLKCRRLIESPWHRANFGGLYRLTGDQNQKTRYDNDKTGYRLATSVGGLGTGEGGDRVVVDDPHNVMEAESEATRESTLLWWDEVMSTRGNDPKTVARVIVMQRVHEKDLSGHVLAQGGYEHLCLPAEYEGGSRVTSIGWSDPRTEEGELLWPERFGRIELDALKHILGPIAAAGQLQQSPVPRVGGIFELGWFNPQPVAPASFAAIVRYWDTAGAKPGQGDWTVGVLMGRTEDRRYWILDVSRFQKPGDERNAEMLAVAKLDAARYPGVKQWVEQPPGLAKESTDAIVKHLAGVSVEADRVTGQDKTGRAAPVSDQLRAGNVFMLEAEWNAPYLAVMCKFPAGAHDDDVDATSGAFNKIALGVSRSYAVY